MNEERTHRIIIWGDCSMLLQIDHTELEDPLKLTVTRSGVLWVDIGSSFKVEIQPPRKDDDE